jgi:hypothetical protein
VIKKEEEKAVIVKKGPATPANSVEMAAKACGFEVPKKAVEKAAEKEKEEAEKKE